MQRVTAALRMLAYGVAAEALDEYLQMSEDSILLSLKEFCEWIVELFQEEYLPKPTEQDLKRIMAINAAGDSQGVLVRLTANILSGKCALSHGVGSIKERGRNPPLF